MNTNDLALVEQILSGLTLRQLHDMEQDAARLFRCSTTPQELVERQAEWRAVEAVYLKRLKEPHADPEQ